MYILQSIYAYQIHRKRCFGETQKPWRNAWKSASRSSGVEGASVRCGGMATTCAYSPACSVHASVRAFRPGIQLSYRTKPPSLARNRSRRTLQALLMGPPKSHGRGPLAAQLLAGAISERWTGCRKQRLEGRRRPWIDHDRCSLDGSRCELLSRLLLVRAGAAAAVIASASALGHRRVVPVHGGRCQCMYNKYKIITNTVPIIKNTAEADPRKC